MFWDDEQRARVLDLDVMSSEGEASLEGQTFFGMDKQVSLTIFQDSQIINNTGCILGAPGVCQEAGRTEAARLGQQGLGGRGGGLGHHPHSVSVRGGGVRGEEEEGLGGRPGGQEQEDGHGHAPGGHLRQSSDRGGGLLREFPQVRRHLVLGWTGEFVFLM